MTMRDVMKRLRCVFLGHVDTRYPEGPWQYSGDPVVATLACTRCGKIVDRIVFDLPEDEAAATHG